MFSIYFLSCIHRCVPAPPSGGEAPDFCWILLFITVVMIIERPSVQPSPTSYKVGNVMGCRIYGPGITVGKKWVHRKKKYKNELELVNHLNLLTLQAQSFNCPLSRKKRFSFTLTICCRTYIQPCCFKTFSYTLKINRTEEILTCVPWFSLLTVLTLSAALRLKLLEYVEAAFQKYSFCFSLIFLNWY